MNIAWLQRKQYVNITEYNRQCSVSSKISILVTILLKFHKQGNICKDKMTSLNGYGEEANLRIDITKIKVMTTNTTLYSIINS